jgi:competence protein ComEC
MLIVTPEGNTVLIDGGPKSSGSNVVSYLKNQGITEINVIVATHPHEDHIGGLISVLDSCEVGNVIDAGVEHTSQTYKNYLSIINSKNINFVNWNLGQQFDIGPAVSFKIIGPILKTSSDLNNSSIVIKLTHISTSFLFTGDAESESESKILQSSADVEADVLKVGHHGSSSSSTVKFLKAVSPSVAVISCGQGNSYGHPHDSTLKNLSSLGITIYRTDTTGTIVIESDGKNINVISGKSFDYVVQVETKSPETSSSETSASNETNTSLEKQGQYCGSVNSDVFHKQNCSYVNQISNENLVWYETREEAIAKGKRPCKRCGP